MKKLALLAAVAAFSLPVSVMAQDAPGTVKKDSYRFVIVPKVVHPWFDKVNEGAQQAAAALKAQTGANVEIVYSAPQSADVVQQNQIIDSALATRPAVLHSICSIHRAIAPRLKKRRTRKFRWCCLIPCRLKT